MYTTGTLIVCSDQLTTPFCPVRKLCEHCYACWDLAFLQLCYLHFTLNTYSWLLLAASTCLLLMMLM